MSTTTMTAKPSVTDDSSLKLVEQETQHEIDEILSEVEELRKELNGETSIDSLTPEGSTPENPSDDQIAEALASETADALQSALDKEVTESDDLMKEFRNSFGGAGSEDAGLEETLGELKEEESASGRSLLDTVAETPAPAAVVAAPAAPAAAAPAATVTPIHTRVTAPAEAPAPTSSGGAAANGSGAGSPSALPGELTLSLTGNMTLRLKYQYEGQEVMIGFVDQCLKVELADGTEFKIPVGSKSGRRVA